MELHEFGGVDDSSLDGFVFDDAGILFDIRNPIKSVAEGCDVGFAADFPDLLLCLEKVGKGDEVDGIASIGESEHGPEQESVLDRGKVFGAEDLADFGELGIVAEDGAEDGAFSLEVRGQGWHHVVSASFPDAPWAAVTSGNSSSDSSQRPASESSAAPGAGGEASNRFH